MLFDRQSSVRGLVAAALVTVAMTSPGARAAPSTPIEGTSYFVAPGGVGVSIDRTRPGNVNDTVRKICDGTAAQIAGGDAIVFLDGTYLTSALNLPLPADARQSGRHGNAIAMLDRNCGGPLYVKLLADNAREAILRNDVIANDTSGGFDIRASSYIWIEGFTIIGINNAAVPWEGGIKFSDGSHHVVALNNYIQGTGGGGIGAGGATNIRIERNEIYNTANMHPYCASAISLYRLENTVGAVDDENGYSNYLVGNKVFGTRSRAGCDADTNPDNGVRSSDGNCIIFDLNNETGYANRTLVANNVCSRNGGGGIHVFNSSFVDVFNNTLYGNGAVHRLGDLSVTCNGAAETRDVRFANNMVVATSNAPAVATNFGTGCVMRGIVHARNLFVGNAPLVNDFIGVPYLQTTTDGPLFRDSASANLVGVTPLDFAGGPARSPIVDAGVATECALAGPQPCTRPILPAEFVTDVNGNDRVSGAGIDVGATEYQAGTDVELPPPTTSLTVRARATLAAGVGANGRVIVNGRPVGELLVATTEASDYTYEFVAGGTIASLDIAFLNDAVVGTEDRNLIIESIMVDGVRVFPGEAQASLDRGEAEAAFDGVDVLPGQAQLWWNGALRLVLPTR